MLQELAPDQLWIADAPFALMGFELGARMTLVRLPGGLFIHSPVALTPDLKAALDRLGPVACLVAPSRYHYLHAAEFARAYPDARLFCAPRLEPGLKGLPLAGALGDEPPPDWAGVLEQSPFRGSSLYDEVDFFHPATRTLILTDLLFNIPRRRPWLTRLIARSLGILGRPGLSPSFRLTMRDRAAARASIERLLAWDFDRVIFSHGDIIETGGKEALQGAFAWLLR
jgi:Domain of unknown function (DUF4336)